ncbi:acyltransferase [Dorea formicigenerans]|uniref:acyltransferase family protein n=2 Tax=Dorea formicigenerans TaxID=39486 RepID=UPI001D0A5F58|nr:acyltransferase family protein [Dorea formicigenerans]MCB8576832.1 acyltransferase [Dorea formicigenerans]MCG4712298.1 acyltransferase [Dorea formicigenerans]
MGKKRRYITGLDGIRAIAVIMVLSYHLKLSLFKSGFLGVTVFFVLSGYLITGILISEVEEEGTIDLKNFWLRRIRRLVPAVMSMAVVIIFVSAVVNRVIFTKGCKDFLASVLGFNNWWQIFNKVSYFEAAGVPSPFTHCWSLAIETQFYLIYPLILLGIYKLAKSRGEGRVKRGLLFAGVTLLLALISVILMIVLFDPQKDASRVYYGTDTRAFSLLFGALLAIMWEYRMVPRRLSASVNMVLGSVSFAALLVMTIAINGSSNFWYRGGQFVGTILTVLMVYAVSGRKTWLSRFLSNPVLKWIGDRSYSLYLWHYPIILLISKGIKASWWITLIEIVLSVVLAELSYRFIETPIRHGIIGEYLNILRSRPRSRQEKKRQVQVARRSLKVMAGTFVLTVSLILCMVFVPKKNALDILQKREAKAKETGKMTEEQLAKQKANGSESDDTICTADLTDDEILEGLNLLLIGDSIAVDVTDDFYEIFPNSVSDTKIGRITSLGKQVLDSYIDEKKWEGEGVIFASLSNSPINGELEDIREKIGKDMPLFLTTVRIPHDTFEDESNSKIKKFVEENDHTYLIDWYAASEGHDEYFDADDTHLLSAGAKAYAKCVKEAVLDVYKKENIEIPKSRLSSGTDTSKDSSNDSSTDPSTDSSNDSSTDPSMDSSNDSSADTSTE